MGAIDPLLSRIELGPTVDGWRGDERVLVIPKENKGALPDAYVNLAKMVLIQALRDKMASDNPRNTKIKAEAEEFFANGGEDLAFWREIAGM